VPSRPGPQVLLYGTQVLKAFAQCSGFTGAIIAVQAAPTPVGRRAAGALEPADAANVPFARLASRRTKAVAASRSSAPLTPCARVLVLPCPAACAPQEQLGAVNGVGQTLAAFVRGVGPALGGVLWAASLELQQAGQQFLTFTIIALLAFGTWLLFRQVALPNLK
jgi:hypothetical protein